METADIDVGSIAPKEIKAIDKDVNPNKQSQLVELGNNVIIARPLSERYTGLKAQLEIERRKAAVKLHEDEIPQYTQHKGFVLLQGFHGKNGEEEQVPMLGRFMDKMTNVKKVTELSTREVLSDIQLCDALTKLSVFQLKQLLSKSVLIDQGNIGSFGKELPGTFKRIAKYLTSDDVCVGFDQSGERKIFCDPDWFVNLSKSKYDSKMKLIHSARLAARVALFYSATKINRIRDRVRYKEKVIMKPPRIRVAEKSKAL